MSDELEREALALLLWDEGIIRPENLAREVVDCLLDSGRVVITPTPQEAEMAEVLLRDLTLQVQLAEAHYEPDGLLQVTRERDIDAAARALYEHEHIGTKREPNWDGEAAKHVHGVWSERARVVLEAAKNWRTT